MICILCGCSNPNHPLHPTDSLLELVRSRACNGPIAWRAIMTWDQPTVCACRMCFHQLRRIKPRQKDRQPLPLDAAVLQTIVPGTMRQQDSRTRERICAALRTPGNAYSRTFEALTSLLDHPLIVKEESESGDETMMMPGEESATTTPLLSTEIAVPPAPTVVKKRIEIWWKYNLQTECFSHKAIARHVRRCGL
jgi:hypothetical protein